MTEIDQQRMANPRLIRLSHVTIPTKSQSVQLRDTMNSLYSDLDAAEENLRLSRKNDEFVQTLSEYMAILSPFKDSLGRYLEELEDTIRIDGARGTYSPL